MRLARCAHVGAILAIASYAVAQPAQRPLGQPLRPPPPPTTGDPFAPVEPPAGTVVDATVTPPPPAGSSAVESSDVPEWQPAPPRVAVAPFENRANVRVFDWLISGAPFEAAQKSEAVLGLDAAGGVLYVGARPVPPLASAVAQLAREQEATWVLTGWVERPNWEMRIAVALWRVDAGIAIRAHQAVRTGPVNTYHALLGGALGEVWSSAGFPLDTDQLAQFARPLATDVYAVNLMGRGLGHLIAANAIHATDPSSIKARDARLKSAQHDLERAVFIDPKCAEAQRLVGELYLSQLAAGGDPKLASKAAGKFNYAHDLAPADLQALRAAAAAAVRGGKAEAALPLLEQLVVARPWDLDARYQYGAALWQTGDARRAERQLAQVKAKRPDHLPTRRVLVLIHAARNETASLVGELEAIAQRAPTDLDVKADLASAYGELGRWDEAIAALEAIAAARAPELALLVRIGDAYRRLGKLEQALAWYTRAQKEAPDSSIGGYLIAQAQVAAGRLDDAARTYTSLLKFSDLRGAAEHALGVIAYRKRIPGQAAWNLRKATKDAPRELRTWHALIAAEILRKDAATARAALERALVFWPDDSKLQLAREAIARLEAGQDAALAYEPELVEPWGDAAALQLQLDRFTATNSAMATVRLAYQSRFLTALGALGKGPYASVKAGSVRVCPVGVIAPQWSAAQTQLRSYERLGTELEASWRYLARHIDVGADVALLPNARAQLATAKRAFRTALADVWELRAEWTRTLSPELRIVGCTDKLLTAALANPQRYAVPVVAEAPPTPAVQPPRPRARATFHVDNTKCPDPVDVWIDGAQIGQVTPGRRSALVADAGEHTLCLVLPGSAQCGDRGTVRQIYLHDGWAVTMHCPR